MKHPAQFKVYYNGEFANDIALPAQSPQPYILEQAFYLVSRQFEVLSSTLKGSVNDSIRVVEVTD